MQVSLSKGQFVDLSKSSPNLKRIRLGLKWGANKYAGPDADLDCSVFCTNHENKVTDVSNFVFYNNLGTPCRGVVHTGDNRKGGSDNDDETLLIDLTKISPSIHNMHFVITIHDAIQNRQNFGQMETAVVTMYDEDTNQKLCHFELGTDYSTETALRVATLLKSGSGWGFRAVGRGHAGGLPAFVQEFGMTAN